MRDAIPLRTDNCQLRTDNCQLFSRIARNLRYTWFMNDQPTLAPLQIELREAMADPGCPLCRLAARAERNFVDSLNYERVLDLKTRDALKASRGLCARHTRQWQALQGSALSMAIVYRVSILDLLRDTETLPQAKLWRRGKDAAQLAQALEPDGPCLVCEIGAGTVQRFADLLLKDLPDPAVQTLLRDCGGLCVPHLRLALTRPGAGKQYRLLIDVHRAAWQTLMGELDEFIRKNDYRFRHEKLGETEADAWLRALDTMVGMDAKLKKR